MMHRSVCS